MSRHHPLGVGGFLVWRDTLMKWKHINPATVDPEQFDLSEISTCRVKEYSGTDNMRSVSNTGCSLFVDLLKTCPVTGQELKEYTWYLFAAQGLT